MRRINEGPLSPDEAGLSEVIMLGTLFTWFSPAFPTGGFAYSHGLETAAADDRITTQLQLADWLEDVLRHGAGWSDAVLLSMAHRSADAQSLREVCDLAAALPTSHERWIETMSQGDAFVTAVRTGWPWLVPPLLGSRIAHPVAAGAIGARIGASAELILIAYLTGFCSNLIGAAVRLSLCGQSGGLRILASLGPVIAALAERGKDAGEHDLGGCALMSDIVSMRHETQAARVFRT